MSKTIILVFCVIYILCGAFTVCLVLLENNLETYTKHMLKFKESFSTQEAMITIMILWPIFFVIFSVKWAIQATVLLGIGFIYLFSPSFIKGNFMFFKDVLLQPFKRL